MRRVFVAIKISERLADEIASWKDGLRKKSALADGTARDAVRWIEKKNLHITLVPPWRADDDGIRTASAAIHAAINSLRSPKPFLVEFSTVAYGPDQRRPRLIWASGDTPQAVTELKAAIEKELSSKAPGMSADSRPFRLHLTLARFRPEDFQRFPSSAKTLSESISWRDEVRSVALMESRLSPAGADYEVIYEAK